MRGLVLGRGRSTPQVLQSVQWESPLLHGGVVTDADSTAAVQAAHDALPAGGGIIYMPGLWKCTQQLVISKSVYWMGRKDGRAGGGANADGIWFTTTGAPPLTRSTMAGGVRAWLDGTLTASMSFQNMEIRGPTGAINTNYLIDLSYATTFLTIDTLINGASTTGLKAHVCLGGGNGGAGAFTHTNFSGVAADAGTRYCVDNPADVSSGTMNAVELDDVLLTNTRGPHNPGNNWLLERVTGEVLNAEGTLALVTCDAGLAALDTPSWTAIECSGVDTTGAGDGGWFLAAGNGKIIGGQFELRGASSLWVPQDTCQGLTDLGVTFFSTGGVSTHVLNQNSKTVNRFISWPSKLAPGSGAMGASVINGTPDEFDYYDIATGEHKSNVVPVMAGTKVSTTVSENIRRDDATSNAITAPVRGNVNAIAVDLRQGQVVTTGTFVEGATALVNAGGGNHFWEALYDSAGRVIRQSTDDLAAAWTANTGKTKNLDSVPVTAGARAASTTVTLTLANLSQDLTTIVAVGDSIVVSNANIAAYNGTFTVTAVTATTLQYTAGSSATDSLAAPFPTVQLAAGKRTYTVPTSGVYYLGLNVDGGATGTQPTLTGRNVLAIAGVTASPVLNVRDATAVTGTAVVLTFTPATPQPYGFVS